MNNDPSNQCAWTERVSALIDGELPGLEMEMAETHLSGCARCGSLFASSAVTGRPASTDTTPDKVSAILTVIPDRLPPSVRAALVVGGGMLLAGSAPDFVRGNTGGDLLHDLRHLAIWQTAVGVTAVAAAFTFRLSRLLAVMFATFLSLTIVAALYDLLTGHRGPWTDPLHIIEVVTVVLLLRLAWPHLRMISASRASVRGHRRPARG